MTWTAPDVARPDDPVDVPPRGERATLVATLEWNRATFLWKCAGLTGDQLARRPVPPSSLSLLGIVRHLTDAERAWFRRHLRGEAVCEVHFRPDDPDAAFDGAEAAGAEADYAALLDELGASRAAIADAALDLRCADEECGGLTLQAVLVHMINEYGRHNGHADLLRECIDGATGE